MKSIPKRYLVAGAIVLAGTAAAGAAFAGVGDGRGQGARSTAVFAYVGNGHLGCFGLLGHGDTLAAAAAYLGSSQTDLLSQLRSGKTLAQIANATSGKSADGLIDALVQARTKELDAAVAAEKLTSDQEQTLLSGLKQRVTDFVNGTLRVGPGLGIGHHFGGDLSAAATYLGLTESDLLTQLRSGKTLAQIANATSGKSADGLIEALVSAATKRLDAAVAAGKLTSSQEQTILSTLKQRITDVVNRVRPQRGFGIWPGPGGPRDGHGFYPGILGQI